MICHLRLLGILSTLAIVLAAGPAGARPDPLDTAIARVQPSLVRIRVVWTEYAMGREVKQQASGSGVIISRKGHVITNHHVAGRAARIVCILSNNEEIEAELVGADPLSDLAVLQLVVAAGREFPAVKFGDSAAVKVGEEVLAMGSPLALSQSVTRGIISNTKMVMPGSYRDFDRLRMSGEPVGAMVRWLAHDAPIFPGNSGGPLVNLKGEVIGINEISFGLGGAIPSNLAREVSRQLIAHGQVKRSWLGMEFQPLLKDSPTERGALIREVVDGSPAAEAGIVSGDVLLSLNGRDITVKYDEEIPLINQQVASLPLNQPVSILLMRDGKTFKRSITPTLRELVERKNHELKEWGITATDLSQLAAKELKLDGTNGVLVTSVRPAGPAGRAKPSLQTGDVLRSINDQPINDAAGLIAQTAAIIKHQAAPVAVLLRFERPPEQFLTVVEVGIQETTNPAMEARKAWLPVALQVVTRDLARQLGEPDLAGLRITEVYAASTADRDGILVGDIIVAVDDEPVTATEPGDEESFQSRIRQYRIGAKPQFMIWRNTKRVALPIELERTPLLEREMAKYEDIHFEFTARDLSFFDRVRENWKAETTGALVTEVKNGGWAALGELAPNDLIQTVDGEPIANVHDFEIRMNAVLATKQRFVVLRILRGIHVHYLQLETTWNNQQGTAS